jgi:hypothetical protein
VATSSVGVGTTTGTNTLQKIEVSGKQSSIGLRSIKYAQAPRGYETTKENSRAYVDTADLNVNPFGGIKGSKSITNRLSSKGYGRQKAQSKTLQNMHKMLQNTQRALKNVKTD